MDQEKYDINFKFQLPTWDPVVSSPQKANQIYLDMQLLVKKESNIHLHL